MENFGIMKHHLNNVKFWWKRIILKKKKINEWMNKWINK